MSPVILYLLKVSVSLTVACLLYQLLLSRLTFYNWNRVYLIAIPLLAMIIPFINISPVIAATNYAGSPLIESVPALGSGGNVLGGPASPGNSTVPLEVILKWLYFAGLFFLLTRAVFRFLSVGWIRKKAKRIEIDNIVVYHIAEDIVPFSFGRKIFINAGKHETAEMLQMIRHEQIHVKQYHTVDILFAELISIVNWFNPFAWVLRAKIRQNLEFIADREVLKTGVNLKNYQALMLKAMGISFTMTPAFNTVAVKNRLIMMGRSQSHRVNMIRFLAAVPLLLLLLLLFRSVENNVGLRGGFRLPLLSVNTPGVLSPSPEKQMIKKISETSPKTPGQTTSVKIEEKTNNTQIFFTITIGSTTADVQNLKTILRKANYDLEVLAETYTDGRLTEFSGTLGGEAMKNDLTTSMNFSVTKENAGVVGCNPANGKLYFYNKKISN